MWINFRPDDLRTIAQRVADTHPHIAKTIDERIEENPQVDNLFIEQARDQYAARSDDNIEVDDGAVVSHGDDGAFVMGWLYIRREDIPGICESCGAIPGEPDYGTVGDGYDGLCPSCADKESRE